MKGHLAMHAVFARPGKRERTRWILWPLLLLVGGLTLGCAEDNDPIRQVAGGNPESGQTLIKFYECGSCHVVPGVQGARGTVGPPLSQFGRRSFIAGAVANNSENLIRWIVNPAVIEPGTAMPAVGVTPTEARDIAAYLYTLQ